MVNRYFRLRHLSLLAAATCGLAATARAQSPRLGTEPVPAAWAEVMYPSWDESGYSAWLLNVGARFRIGSSATVLAEVPMVTSSVDGGGSEDGFLLGNPYVGLRWKKAASAFSAELGFRAPVVGSDAPLASELGGYLADYDNAEAYLPETWAGRLDLAYDKRAASGLHLVFGAGPTYISPKDGDAEWIIDYRAGLGYGVTKFDVTAWFTGRYNASADNADFGERTVHQITIAGTMTGGRARPTLFVRIPMDKDLTDALNAVFGLGVTLGF